MSGWCAGEVLTVENSLLPSLTAKGSLEAQQINLAALGFNQVVAGGVWYQSPGQFAYDCEGEYG